MKRISDNSGMVLFFLSVFLFAIGFSFLCLLGRNKLRCHRLEKNGIEVVDTHPLGSPKTIVTLDGDTALMVWPTVYSKTR